MNKQEILSKVDHTLLKQTATWEQIKAICDEGVENGVASLCIPPCYIKQAVDYVQGKVIVGACVGFPNGYSTTAVKVFETEDAIRNGAREVDMVANIGYIKAGEYDKVLEEIRAIKQACSGNLLKVIIETCFLTEEEKIKMCDVVSESGAEYIKTSTGFAAGGATFADVKLLREHVASHVKVKAAGGISTIADAEEFIALGADRLGTSRLIPLFKNQECENTY